MKTVLPMCATRTMRIGVVSIVAVFVGAAWASYGQQEKEPSAVAPAAEAAGHLRLGGEEGSNRPELQRRNSRYQLSLDDTFVLTFPFVPEFNQTVTVHPDGFVTLAGVGDLYVAGKTVPELRELLQAKYQGILHDPVIDIVLKDFEKPYFIAAGEVGHPGKYELRGDTTLTEAIAIAGGFSENSKHSRVVLFHRAANGWAEAKVVNVKKLFQTDNLTEDVRLQPGDMFFVPQNSISKIKKWIPYTSVSAGAIPLP